ncbi:ankyrin repeat protein, putative [Trichomonas vaginalis G3]|uniref:Ankyrin repeat protein, putative n=1 Tax=Trichomonas vaginalis (strain ATCC PRA-98 / G3) TaxID=412133 RepID=A2F462_TRIV3|nr:proteasome regulatory particle assembly [Trichomonas vaginalis G3]EAY00309.1 ankyrin repeat protein, putative [Trichomonas vaginalis G3]KAI5490882.1 proteasome regulatory particle assembly [Trichomonas vaginalis G3]|eukprot:XP_001313238.1 ankyrin repeat protein [Trichomonas vaginalis G3]
MRYAIISHNIDFVTFLMNEHNLKIDLMKCGKYKNLESFLVYFDQTNDIDKCFVDSAMFNITSLCKYFLSNGAKINEVYEFGKTALHYSAEINGIETAELLISHRANINEKDHSGKIALHYAARYNYKETVEFLISHGTNINAKDRYGKTDLQYATINNNNKEFVELLISHGANINEKDKVGETAPHMTTMANIDEKDQYGNTLLYNASCKNKIETAEFLISHNPNINEKDKNKKIKSTCCNI